MRGGVAEGASAEWKGTSREGVVGALMSAAVGHLQRGRCLVVPLALWDLQNGTDQTFLEMSQRQTAIASVSRG